MEVVVLLENQTISKEFVHKHGLSLYIETLNHKILFDTSPDDSFLINAKKMGIDLSDVDNSTLETATVTLTNYKNGDVIGTDNLPSGITATVTNGVVVLTGTATISAYEDALKSLTFTSTSSDRTPRDFEITVNDGSKTSNTMELHLDIGGCEINPGEYSQSINILIESNGDVKENESVTFTVKIDKSINEDTIVTLSNGDKVTIEAGKTSAIYTLPSQGDDVFKDPSSVTISVESAEVPTNSNITLNINNSVAKVDISDTIDKVYAVISVDKSSIIEGGTLVYTVKLVDENGTEVTVPNGKNINVEIDWSGNASNGSDTSSLPSNINIIGGTSSTSFDVITLDDKYYEGNEPLIATITKVIDSNSIFESLNIGTNKTANSQIIDNDNFSLSIDSVMVDEDAL